MIETQQANDHQTSICEQEDLLITKLRIPRVPGHFVARPHLLRLLEQGIQRKLILIVAPLGFGKTTLLSQWQIAKAEDGMPCAWLALDERDNDPARFLAYLLSSLQTIEPEMGKTLLPLLQAYRHPSISASILTMLINKIVVEMLYDFAIVLDDYHAIEAPVIHTILTFLLNNLPSQVHVVIASRTEPPLPLAYLRARGQLAELYAAEMRFQLQEGKAFLNEVMNLGLNDVEIAELETHMEGWIVGLQLAAYILQKQEGKNGGIKAITGSHRYILDYLANECFYQQTPRCQAFLLKTSILNRFNGALCEAVTGLEDGDAMLRKIEHTNIPIFSVDEEGQWYRYHPLFRDFLYHQLLQVEPDGIFELHQRAKRWCEEHDHLLKEVSGRILAVKDIASTSRVVLSSRKDSSTSDNKRQHHLPQQEDVSALVEPLSIRELEVLRPIIRGLSIQEIANLLCLSEYTIKWHIRNIYEKLQVHRRTQLIRRVQELGLCAA